MLREQSYRPSVFVKNFSIMIISLNPFRDMDFWWHCFLICVLMRRCNIKWKKKKKKNYENPIRNPFHSLHTTKSSFQNYDFLLYICCFKIQRNSPIVDAAMCLTEELDQSTVRVNVNVFFCSFIIYQESLSFFTTLISLFLLLALSSCDLTFLRKKKLLFLIILNTF